MNDQAIKDAFGLDEPNDEPKETLSLNEAPDPEPIQNQGPTAEELNDPNSDYWKEQAKEQGWNEDFVPKDGEFQKTPREFVKYGEMYNYTHRLNQKIDRIDQEHKEQREADLNLQRVAYESRLQELEGKRNDAVETADRETFDKVDKEIQELRQNAPEAPKETPQALAPIPTSDAVHQFEAENPWFKVAIPGDPSYNPADPDFQKASYVNWVYAQQTSQGKEPDEALEIVKQGLKDNFPEVNSRRERAPASELGGRKPSGAQKIGFNQLSAKEQTDIDKYIQAGIYKDRDEAVEVINKHRGEL